MSSHYRGSCLCGEIRYEVNGELSEFGYCHCRSCRKASGSAHGANIGVERDDVTWHDPKQLQQRYQSSPGKWRVFCQQCGSPLYAYLDKHPNLIRIRLGSLDTPLHKTAKAHTFVADKADWDTIDDSIPAFDEWAPRQVLHQAGSHQP